MLLFKYLSPSRTDVLENLKIRFTQAPYLNDPYENNPVITDWEISDQDWRRVAEIEAKRNGVNLKDFEALNNKQHRKEVFPEALQLFKVVMQYSTGILSLSETYSDPLMWAHYGGNHKGFVLGLKTDHPFFNTTGKEFTTNNISKVIYSKLRPQFSARNITREGMFFTKSDHWAYEREWRLIKHMQDADSFENGIALFNLPTEVIESIYLGAACSLETEEKVIDSVNKHKLSLRIQKMVLNPESFGIDDISFEKWIDVKNEIKSNEHLLRAIADIREYLNFELEKGKI